MSQSPLNTQAPQDTVIQSGFLNHFRWANQNQRSAWVYLNKQDGTDQNGNKVYQSIFCQVFGNTARMLAHYHQQIQQAKQSGQRMTVLVQIHVGTVTSFTPQNQQGAPSQPVTYVKGFKAYVLNPQDRMVTDFSDSPQWNEQSGQQGGYAPQGQAPQQGYSQNSAPQQNQAPQSNQAPQQNYAPQQNHQAPQGGQQPAPMAEPDFDFDDDIPF